MRKQTSRAGFTLIELIIVLLVLASLAALIVPTLGFVKDQSDSSMAANGAKNVLNNLETFRATTGSYPDRLDSLTNQSGAYYAAAYSTGAGDFPFGTVQPMSSVAGGFGSYYLGQSAGFTQLAVHDETSFDGLRSQPNFVTNPNGFATATDINAASVCVIDPANFNSFYVSKGRRIVNACFPNQRDPLDPQIPDGHTLVALGVGGINSAVGNTMADAPLCPEKTNSPAENYDRYIAVFSVSAGTGRGRVRLKAVLDSEFEVVDTNVREFRDSRLTDAFGS